MKKTLIICLILRGVLGFSQNDPTPFAATITPSDLRSYLEVLTSDSLEGRETGTVGNQRAANFIARHFEKLDLPTVGEGKTYFQRMVYTNESWKNIGLEVNDQVYRNLFNFYAFPGTNAMVEGKVIQTDEVVFLGFGIDDERYSDYKKVDVKGKVILIYQGEPMKGDSISVITKTRNLSNWSVDGRRKLKLAFDKGAKAVLIVDGDLAKSVQEGRRFFSRNVVGDVERPDGKFANSMFISPEVAKIIIGAKAEDVRKARERMVNKGKSRAVTLPCRLKITMDKNFSQLISNNVLGFIEGSDPKLKDEIVVVTGHYDHLGKRGNDIYRGADDDGSGTSGVMEVAQAFVEAKKMGKGARRSVLCMLVTGEEKGLLGSRYYVNNPIFPLEKTVADVNIDMIGRVDDKYQAQNNPNYIYVIGSDKLSSDLHKINEAMNEKYTKLVLDYTYNDDNDPNRYYYRSDHYNFAERGIPVVFYFNGTHADYHRPTDTIDKINFEKMTKIAQLAFYTAWEIANRDERLKVDKVQKR